MILILIIIGFGATKAGMITKNTRANMIDLVLYIILPCNIFSAFHKGTTPEILRQCFVTLLAAFGMQLLYIIINRVAYNKIPLERRIVFKYATIVNNAAFIGLPVIGTVFGPTGVLYGSVALIPMRVFMWTMGLALFTDMELKRRLKVLCTHPCIWAVILGLAYIFVPFELPVFLMDTIAAVSACTTVLPMLVIGSILSEVNPRDILDKDCLYYSLFRLIIIPAIMLGALMLLRVDPLVTGVMVLLAAMPSSTTSVMLAEKYGRDSNFAAKTIIVSTILSIISLPFVAEALKRLGIS